MKAFRNYLSLHKKWLFPTFLSLLMTLLLAVSYLYKPATIAQLGNLATDHFHRTHPREYNPDTPVRIIDIDEESIARIGQWPWMLARVGERVFPSLTMDALRAAQGARSFAVKSSNASGELQAIDRSVTEVTSIKVGNFTVPSDENGRLQLYLTETRAERYIPAWEILLTFGDWEERVGGHIVFIGTSAEGLKDIKSTALNPAEPGVTVHAQAAEQIINEQYLLRPYWASMIEMFTLVGAGVLLALALPRLSAAKGAILTLIIGLVIWQCICHRSLCVRCPKTRRCLSLAGKTAK